MTITTTRKYRWDDAGAPTLNGTVGSLITVLKTCLVGTSGIAYGSTPAAGWTTEYEDSGAYKIAFRNSIAAGGSGAYVRVLDDGSGTSADGRQAHINAYKTMSDVDTGTDATPAPVSGYPGKRIEKSNAATSTAVPWYMLADERTFYICTQVTSRGRGILYGAGDFHSHVPGDSFNVFVCGGGAVVTDNCKFALPVLLGRADGTISVMRNAIGDSGVVGAGVAALASTAGQVAYGNSSAAFVLSATLGFAWQCAPALLSCADALRGELRGMSIPLFRTNGMSTPLESAGYEAGSSVVLLPGTYSYNDENAAFQGALVMETALPWQQ